jgi:hypothetical protein
LVILSGCDNRAVAGPYVIYNANGNVSADIAALNLSKLDKIDQRYNDTFWVKANFYNKSFIDNLTMNGTVTKLYVDTQDTFFNNSQKHWIQSVYYNKTSSDSKYLFTNGSGISLIGLRFNHSDTSSVSNTSNTGTIVIQNIYFDKFGHVLGYSNKTIASGVTQTYVDNQDIFFYNKSANFTIAYVIANVYNKSYIDSLTNASTLWILNGTVLHPRNSYSISTENYATTFGFKLYVNGNAYIRTLNVSNSTIFLGTTRLTASNQTLIINNGQGNVSAKYYLGSAKYLTDIDFNTSSPTFINYNNSIWNGIWTVDNRTTIVNNSMINITNDLYLNKLNITDQRYNDSLRIDALNLSKLDKTDQRYNETGLIKAINQTLNVTGIYALINTKLNITDQRYNETSKIYALNQSKLDKTDQRYNDTALIKQVNSSLSNQSFWVLNKTVIHPKNNYQISTENRNDTYGYKLYINGTGYIKTLNVSGSTINLGEAQISATGGSLKFTGGFANVSADYYYGSGKYLRDLNVSLKLNITDQRYNETYLILYLNNLTNVRIDALNQSLNLTPLYLLINTKLNITDQRYNDTFLIGIERQGRINNDSYLYGLINAINLSTNTSGLSARIDMLNLTKLDKTDQRYNETLYINNQLLNYYNISEINNLLINFYNITEIDSLLDLKLNVTDQRYNETSYINNLFLNYYNSSQIDSFLDLKLNISDQRYNDTAMIQAVNSSLKLIIDTKLNITDQRYNDTALILLVNNSINLSGIYSLLDTKLNITDQRYNETSKIYALNQSKLDKTDQRYNESSKITALNLSKLDKVDQRYNETGLVVIERNRITALNLSKLDKTDQRYNETQKIYYLNLSKLDKTDQRYNESSKIIALNLSKLDKTDQRYNDTLKILAVNLSLDTERTGRINNDTYINNRVTTVNNSFGIFQEFTNITVTGGNGFNFTNCCSGMAEILNIRVVPLSSTNKYRFYANTSITGEVVDSDRAMHTGTWDIAHRGSVVNNENINYYITNAQINEKFSVRVRYSR